MERSFSNLTKPPLATTILSNTNFPGEQRRGAISMRHLLADKFMSIRCNPLQRFGIVCSFLLGCLVFATTVYPQGAPGGGDTMPFAENHHTFSSGFTPTLVDLTQPPSDLWQRIRYGFAVPNLDSPLVAERQAWFVARPQQLKIMFERSSLYLYYITQECERRGLPTELALLPFIESAFNPHALSPARASGLWQFIPSTGKSYGLQQNTLRDERRDIIASTNAALDYLTTLYEMYGDWYLALASYNWGEGSVARAIDKNRSLGLPTDYLSLQMPDETRNYVPRLQAIKNIISSPDAFKLSLPQIDNEPYFTTIVKPRHIEIKAAAKMADMSVEEFKALNPSFKRPPMRKNEREPEHVTLLVPISKLDTFITNMDRDGRNGAPSTGATAPLPYYAANVPPVGLKGRMSSGNARLAELSGASDALGGGLYRDPYEYAQQASLHSQQNPLAQIRRYSSEDPPRRVQRTTYTPRLGRATGKNGPRGRQAAVSIKSSSKKALASTTTKSAGRARAAVSRSGPAQSNAKVSGKTTPKASAKSQTKSKSKH
ncbi:MAG: transglycosylase SLT domain-containing protein [Burkholderiaceae bacterium]